MQSSQKLMRVLCIALLLTPNCQSLVGAYALNQRTDDPPDACEPEDISEVSDGPTVNKQAGIGIEFETGSVMIHPVGKCDPEQVQAGKRAIVGDHQGDNWKLTGDGGFTDQLSLEYILDGTKIPLGQGDVVKAAAAVSQDYIKWDPKIGKTTFDIQGNDCNPWTIKDLPEDPDTEEPKDAKDVGWGIQVTVPMPLEAIYDIIGDGTKAQFEGKKASPLLPSFPNNQYRLIYIKEVFFQSNPNGIHFDAVKNDVLGFLSLVLSYTKADKPYPDDSYKQSLTIMPRTDFTSMYKTVKEFIPGSLYNIVKVLACYKNVDGVQKVQLDENYCTGSLSAPKPNTVLDNQIFRVVKSTPDPKDKDKVIYNNVDLLVKDWIASMENGQTPDKFSVLDQSMSKSLGALGNTFENMLYEQRAVPLFEFRQLTKALTSGMEDRVKDLEHEVIMQHSKHAKAPHQVKARTDKQLPGGKRSANPTSCGGPTRTTSSLPATQSQSHITPAPAMPSCYLQEEDPYHGINDRGCVCGSSTVPVRNLTQLGISATDEKQLCAYTAFPSGATNPISIHTQYYTNNCQACTLVGGVAACTSQASCKQAKPTLTVELSNNSIPIGNADNFNNGSDLRKEILGLLQDICRADDHHCDSTKPAKIDDIPLIVKGGVEYMKLSFTVQSSKYVSKIARDTMLVAAVATWQQAASKNCKEVEYTSQEPDTGSGCGHGELVEDNPFVMPTNKPAHPWGKRLKRDNSTEACADCTTPPNGRVCHYKGQVCSGANNIHVEDGDTGDAGPYQNSMDIEVATEHAGNSDWNEFICELVVEGLEALVMAVWPELASYDLMEAKEFIALCEDLASNGNR